MAIQMSLKITFKNIPPSAAIESHIREAAKKLESFWDKIIACRVLVEAPHRHHRKGKQYKVRIDLTMPGGTIAIKRAPRLIVDRPLRSQKDPDDLQLAENRELSKFAAHDDLKIAIRDAFDAARRKLQDYARRRRGSVKRHDGLPHARIGKLFPESDFGFIETPDGREIYFHRNSVRDGDFEALKVGTEVHFAEEQGEKGPQASTVTPVKHHGGPLRRSA